MVATAAVGANYVIVIISADPPQSKRPRLDSGEMDRILNAKSSHDWINEEVANKCCVCVSYGVYCRSSWTRSKSILSVLRRRRMWSSSYRASRS